MNKPIFITGCARSGTSMTAGVFNICGAWGGKMSGATPNNKKGMFENAEIRNKIVKPALLRAKCDPKAQHPLPKINTFDSYNSEVWRARVLGIMINQGLKDVPVLRWFYKGAKMCLMWRLWNRAFPEATWILVRREDEGIINSCMKTGFMDAFQDEEGWQGWVDKHKECFTQMYKANLKIYEIWPQKMINGDYEEIENIIKCCKLNWKVEEVKKFITPELWRGGNN